MSGAGEAAWPESINGYIIGQELGHGAFSHVCRCTKADDGSIYACKVFPKANLSCPGDHERFQREINTMAFLRHESLVSLYDFFWDETNFYLITDLCSGGELFQYIIAHEKLDESVAANVFRQIASGIAHCHSASVAHRDLKPENILITKFPQIKVADFGLCGFISETQLMRTFCGSPCYCSPECLSKVQYDGRKSDVWSLGVILFAMVTGQLPWNVSNTSHMLRQILRANFQMPAYLSAPCKDLITSMLRALPADRISMEKILDHPWLKNRGSGRKANSGRVSSLPPLPSRSIEDLAAEATADGSGRAEIGIISPFDGQGGLIRAESQEEFRVTSARGSDPTPFRASGRPKVGMTGGGMGLAQNRQRSARNVAMPIPIGKPRNKLELDAITEEGS
jgi:serine/threonine protein kinase